MLNKKQLKILLQAVKNKSTEISVLLALWLGLRQSEICGLQWSHIDFDNSIMIIKQAIVRDKDDKDVIKTTKTYSSTRKLKVHKFIMDKIKNLPKKGDFIINIKGKSIYDAFKKVLRKNNLPDIRFHDLRILNASIMLKLKVPDKYAQNFIT